MKVFLSWSGSASHRIALAFKDWLPRMIQALKPYVSSEDVGKGVRWSANLARELEESQFGIIRVTKQNITAPWLNFEAGALSKAVDTSRVCPFLFGVNESDLSDSPLLQFQHTVRDKQDVLRLLCGMNDLLPEEVRVSKEHLDDLFDMMWPRLENGLKSIPEEAPKKDKDTVTDVEVPSALQELLSLAREQQKMLQSLLNPPLRPIIGPSAKPGVRFYSLPQTFRETVGGKEPNELAMDAFFERTKKIHDLISEASSKVQDKT